MNPIAATTWIWHSALSDETLAPLAAKVAQLGFDTIELPVEELGAWDPGLAAELLARYRLGASLCAAVESASQRAARSSGGTGVA